LSLLGGTHLRVVYFIMKTNLEKFYPVVGYEGIYEINKNGIVKSIIRETNTCGRKPSGKIIKQFIGRGGYLYIALRKNKKQTSVLMHRILAITFIPNEEDKPTVNHKNSIRTDNRLSNLEWNTYSENNSHAHKLGKQSEYYGENHSQSKLKEKQVIEIRSKYIKHKYTAPDLAKEYKVSKGAIVAILNRTTWRNI